MRIAYKKTFALFATLLFSTTTYGSSGLYFSDFSYQNPAELMFTIMPTTDPVTGKQVEHTQRLTLAESNVWYWTQYAGISGPAGFTAKGTVSAWSYNPLVSFGYTNRICPKFIFGLNLGHILEAYSALPRDSFIAQSEFKSDFEAWDFAPNLSYEVNKQFSIGAGLDIEYLYADLLNMQSALPGFLPPAQFEIITSGYGWGWHAGVVYQPKLGSILSLAYYSSVLFPKLTGNSSWGYPGIPSTTDRAHARLPAVTRLKGVQFFNQMFALIGRVDYVNWSSLQTVNVYNTALGTVPIVFNYRDIWRFGIGALVLLPLWTLEAGFSYEQNPTPSYAERITQPIEATYNIGVDVERTLTANLKAAVAFFHQFNNGIGIHTFSPASTIINQGTSHTSGNELEFRLTVLL
jgi:long-chain fatty acid transport protein